MVSIPTSIRALSDSKVLEIDWGENRVDRLPFRFLRGRCPCAVCVSELTGERIVDVDQVPEDVVPSGMELAGQYALRISWSDGHVTGIYTWEYLDQLARSEHRPD